MRFNMCCHTLGMWRWIFAAMVTCSSPVFSSLTLGQLTTHSLFVLEGLFWGWKCASKPNFGADFLELSQDFKSLAWSNPNPHVMYGYTLQPFPTMSFALIFEGVKRYLERSVYLLDCFCKHFHKIKGVMYSALNYALHHAHTLGMWRQILRQWLLAVLQSFPAWP